MLALLSAAGSKWGIAPNDDCSQIIEPFTNNTHTYSGFNEHSYLARFECAWKWRASMQIPRNATIRVSMRREQSRRRTTLGIFRGGTNENNSGAELSKEPGSMTRETKSGKWVAQFPWPPSRGEIVPEDRSGCSGSDLIKLDRSPVTQSQKRPAFFLLIFNSRSAHLLIYCFIIRLGYVTRSGLYYLGQRERRNPRTRLGPSWRI